MRTVMFPLPMFGFAVATRAALGVGLGLLISQRLSPERRRTVGLALVSIGAATTIPAVWSLRRGMRRGLPSSSTGVDAQLRGATRYPRKGDDPF
jgi:hypothetical protein